MNYGSYVEVPSGIQRNRGRNDWYEAHLVDADGDGIIRYIELERSDETPSFSDLKRQLKRHGSPIDELFTVVAYRTGPDPLTSPVDDDLTFLFIDEQFSSEAVEVTFDLKYFTVERSDVEPAYVDFLGDLSVNSAQGRTSLERDVEDVFSIREITRSFYEEFGEIFRGTLQGAIHDLEAPDENLNAYTRTVVNRVLFLMFIEEKGWLDGDTDYVENRYEAATADPDKHLYHDLFEPLFFEALSNTGTTDDEFLGRIPFLNGGLFERAAIERDVTIDEAFFDALLDPEEDESGEPKGFLRRYKISLRESNPSEQELVVDPEFIGRIFEMFMQADERSEVGAFYTPKPITTYMTKNALKQHLLERTDLTHEQVVSLVSDHAAPESLTPAQADAVDDALRSASVLDPAVGSGAFVIAMLEELVAVAEAVDATRDDADAMDRFERKQEFIADNLYGVDIDAGGIELCKFRVWLHLMQDLNVSHEEFLDRNEELALPNLGFKFFVGNSLVGEHDPTRIDVRSYQETLTGGLESTLDEIHETRSDFLTAHGDEKAALGERLEDLTDRLETQLAVEGGDDWMNEVAAEAGSTFAWTSMIPEVILDGGFDIVIGNPPYEGWSQQGYVGELATFYDEQYDFYETIPGMRHDLYQKFIIRGWELTAEEGVLSYITSNTFYTIGSKQSSRRLMQQHELNELIRANPNTFDASVNPAIFALRKTSPPSDHRISYVDASETPINEYRTLVGELGNFREQRPSSDEEATTRLDTLEPTTGYAVDLDVYRNTIRNAFFEPNEENMRLFERFMERIQDLSTEWEAEIQDSTSLENSLDRIRRDHLSQLTEGSVTILGLLTLGGVGIQTGDVEEYTAYLDGSEDAEKIKQRNGDEFEYVEKNDETFRYRSRVIQQRHVRDPSTLSEQEKRSGIDGPWDGQTWVPIEKGFKQGETYYKETYEYVNWSEDAVERIEADGMIKNREYSFEEGILISTGGFSDLAVRYTTDRLIGAPLIIFTTNTELVSPKYLVGVLLSETVNDIAKTFLNSSGMQTTDVRHIPIVIPTPEQKSSVESLVDEAIDCRNGSASRSIDAVRSDIEEIVEELYS
ncbi:SAM-dependent DNA methyltransferase [Halorubrum sp. GN11GM_10-3_MGM]|nr:SAM-dependent DNA methyltransferase [Halorubrum sp. GN11GM_10-3_MGM]